jgi:hypothetical protein
VGFWIVLGAIGSTIRTFMVSGTVEDWGWSSGVVPPSLPQVGLAAVAGPPLPVISVIIAVRKPSLIAPSVSASDLVVSQCTALAVPGRG